MSVEQLESQVLALPLAERRAFTCWLDEHRDETKSNNPLPWFKHRSAKSANASLKWKRVPSLRVPSTEADVKQMFEEIMDERAAKTSSRPR